MRFILLLIVAAAIGIAGCDSSTKPQPGTLTLTFATTDVSFWGGANGAVHNTLGNYVFSAGGGVKWLGYGVQYAFRGDTDTEAALGYSHRVDVVLQLDRLNPGKKPEAADPGRER